MDPLDKPLEENISASPWPTILKYGLIGCAIILVQLGLSTVLTKSGNIETSGIILATILSLFSYAVYIVVMIFAVKEHRDKKQEGFITLGKGMMVSFFSGLLIAIFSTLASILIFFVITPDLYMNALGGSGSSPSFMDESTMQLMMLGSTLIAFIVGCAGGAIVALIISAVMKKERPYNLPRPPAMPPVQ